MGSCGHVLGRRESRDSGNHVPVMTTINDLKTNEMLIRVAQLQGVISAHVRAGDLGRAAWSTADLVAVVRDLEWRIRDLIKESK